MRDKKTKRRLLAALVAAVLCIALITGGTLMLFTTAADPELVTVTFGTLAIELEVGDAVCTGDLHVTLDTSKIVPGCTLSILDDQDEAITVTNTGTNAVYVMVEIGLNGLALDNPILKALFDELSDDDFDIPAIRAYLGPIAENGGTATVDPADLEIEIPRFVFTGTAGLEFSNDISDLINPDKLDLWNTLPQGLVGDLFIVNAYAVQADHVDELDGAAADADFWADLVLTHNPPRGPVVTP